MIDNFPLPTPKFEKKPAKRKPVKPKKITDKVINELVNLIKENKRIEEKYGVN